MPLKLFPPKVALALSEEPEVAEFSISAPSPPQLKRSHFDWSETDIYTLVAQTQGRMASLETKMTALHQRNLLLEHHIEMLEARWYERLHFLSEKLCHRVLGYLRDRLRDWLTPRKS